MRFPPATRRKGRLIRWFVRTSNRIAGDEDPRPGAGDLIVGAVATLHAAGVTARPRVRGDVGHLAVDIAWAAVTNGCDFSLGVTRNRAAWRAATAIPAGAWTRAKRMKGAHAPTWPPCVTNCSTKLFGDCFIGRVVALGRGDEQPCGPGDEP